MKWVVLLLGICLLTTASADLPITDTSAVSPSGYKELSFQIIADFTMQISGLTDGNLTLYIMSNSSFLLFKDQEPFTSYFKQNIFNDYTFKFETGSLLNSYLHVVLVNFGNSIVNYSIDISAVKNTSSTVGSWSLLVISCMAILTISKFRMRRTIRQN